MSRSPPGIVEAYDCDVPLPPLVPPCLAAADVCVSSCAFFFVAYLIGCFYPTKTAVLNAPNDSQSVLPFTALSQKLQTKHLEWVTSTPAWYPLAAMQKYQAALLMPCDYSALYLLKSMPCTVLARAAENLDETLFQTAQKTITDSC